MSVEHLEVTDYIASLEAPERAVVEAFYDRARRLVPEAEEGRSYGMAALRYRGKPLIAVLVGARGITVYPFSAEVVADVVATLTQPDFTKGGIRCTAAEPVPDHAIDALVEGRRAEIDAAA